MRKHRATRVLIAFIIAWLLFMLSSCATGSKFYEVTDRQIYSKKGKLFKFRLNEYQDDQFKKAIVFYSSANWEVTDIVYKLEKK